MEILGLISLPGWLVGCFAFVASLCLYSWYKQNFYTRLGIKQKDTTLFLGDIPILFKKGFGYIDAEMVQKYGKCFGLYLGNTPSLVVCDAEMLKEIMVKQFTKFTDRVRVIPLESRWFSGVNEARGEHWRFLRNSLSSSFSSGKLRHMTAYIHRCQNNMLEILEDKQLHQGEGFDIVPVIRGYTMDVICSTGFGIDVDSQRQPDNPFIKYAKEFFEIDVGKNLIFLLGFLFPELRLLLDRMEIPLVTKECFDFFKATTQKLSAERRNTTSKHKDLLQMMINASNDEAEKHALDNGDLSYEDYKQRGLSDEEILVNSTVFMTAGYDTTAITMSWLAYELSLHPDIQDRLFEEIDENIGKERPTYDTCFSLQYLNMVVNESLRLHPPATSNSFYSSGLSDEEILVNSTVFMTAGYDTTAITMSWLAYELSLHPDIQDRLFEEIDENIGKERPTYDTCFSLQYLNMVVNESLRLHPPATRVNRQAVEDVEICGVPIKKGMHIDIAIKATHYLPEYWPNPEKFDPERFAPENQEMFNQYAYLPFGNGPRNCIGQRLALLEVKMTLIALLQKYKIIKSPKLEVPMPSSKLGLSKPASPVYVILQPRHQ